jgi:hypothetical protein
MGEERKIKIKKRKAPTDRWFAKAGRILVLDGSRTQIIDRNYIDI